jgi:hypothetical protein
VHIRATNNKLILYAFYIGIEGDDEEDESMEDLDPFEEDST